MVSKEFLLWIMQFWRLAGGWWCVGARRVCVRVSFVFACMMCMGMGMRVRVRAGRSQLAACSLLGSHLCPLPLPLPFYFYFGRPSWAVGRGAFVGWSWGGRYGDE